MQSDIIHSCLHSVMAVPPEPEGEGGPQEVSPRAPHPRPCLWETEKRLRWAVWSLVGQRPLPSLQLLYVDTMHALEDLLRSILQRNMTPQGLQLMVEVCKGVHCPGEWAPGSQPSIVSQGPPCPTAAQGHLVLSATGVCG